MIKYPTKDMVLTFSHSPPAPTKQGQQEGAARPMDERTDEGKCLNTGNPHLGKTSPPPPRRSQRTMSESSCELRGYCWAPTPARLTHIYWAADPDCPPEGRAAGRAHFHRCSAM